MDNVFQFHLTPQKRMERILRGDWTHVNVATRTFLKTEEEKGLSQFPSVFLHLYSLKGELSPWLVLFLIEKDLLDISCFTIKNEKGDHIPLNLSEGLLDLSYSYYIKGL